MDLETTRWYANRIASMSPLEIAHRVGEQVKRRQAHPLRLPSGFGPGPLPVIPGLREQLRELGSAHLPVEAWRREREALAGGSFSALGQHWPQLALDDNTRWHLDPVTGRHWPAEDHCFAIPYRNTSRFGDIKYVWEFNRLQQLQNVAALVALTGDEGAAGLCRGEIASWIEANPPYRGVNWSSGIELALRVVSLLIVITLLGPSRLPEPERARLRRCLAAHGYWLHRFPSRFSSANNHIVAEAGALYLLGALDPELPGAARWKRYGRRILEREIDLQIHPDGVGAEQSPTYTAFSLEWWMLTAVIAERIGEPFSVHHMERIGKAGEFLRWLLDADDNHPRIGDDDEGRVVAMPDGCEAYVPAILETLSSVTRRGDLRPVRDYPQLWRALAPAPPARQPSPQGAQCFQDGGYWVVRERRAAGDLLLAFDHGPLGYLSIAAHGHADALAIWLHLGGRPVIIDGGTFLYHSGGAWRDHFRGTAAHSTLMVNGVDSSGLSGAFNWSRKAGVKLLESETSAEGWQVAAEHDGYERLFGVRHCRRLSRVENGLIRIDDRLSGKEGACQVEIGFLIEPGLEVVMERWDRAVVRDGRRSLIAIDHSGPLLCSVVRGAMAPPRGWCSPGFGKKEPAQRIVFAGDLGTETTVTTNIEILV